MALDSTSGTDGGLTFPAWGPLEGPVTGLGVGRDPVLSLFKSGYRVLIIENEISRYGEERERIRRAGQNARTYEMGAFNGPPQDWLEQLRAVRIGLAVSRSDEDTLKFRGPYLRRLRLVEAERGRVPAAQPFEGSFFWHVDRELKLLEEGHRGSPR